MSEKGGVGRRRRWVLGTGLVAVTLVTAVLVWRLCFRVPGGPLSQFAPLGTAVFVHAVRPRECLLAIRSCETVRRGMRQGLFGVSEGQGPSPSLRGLNALSWLLSDDSAASLWLRLLGEEAAVALRWRPGQDAAEWLLLSRGPVAFADLPGVASLLDLRVVSSHAGISIREAHVAGQTLQVAIIGNLFLAAESSGILAECIDAARGVPRAPEGDIDGRILKVPGDDKAGSRPHVSVCVDFGALTLPRASMPPGTDTPSPVLAFLADRLAQFRVPSEVVGLTTLALSAQADLLERMDRVLGIVPFDALGQGDATVLFAKAIPPESSLDEFALARALPPDCGQCSLGSVDPREWFDRLVDGSGQERSQILREVDQYARFLGIQDFRSEFLDLLGPEIGFVISPQDMPPDGLVYPLPAVSLVLQVKVPERIAAFLAKSVERAMEDMQADHEAQQAERPSEERKPFPFELKRVPAGKDEFYQVAMRENYLGSALSPGFGVVGNVLVASSSCEFIREVAECLGNHGVALGDNAQYRRLLSGSRPPFSGLWYVNPRYLGEALLPAANAYIETHDGWSVAEKGAHRARLDRIRRIGELLDAVLITSIRERDRIRVHWEAASWVD